MLWNHLSQLFCITFIFLLLSCAATEHPVGKQTKTAPRLQKLSDDICLDQKTGLLWQMNLSKKTFSSWQEAQKYVQKLSLGEHTNWRLPTRDELYVLHDIIEKHQNGDCIMKQEKSVWSGNTEKTAKMGYWATYLTCGGVDYGFVKMKHGYIRAISP